MTRWALKALLALGVALVAMPAGANRNNNNSYNLTTGPACGSCHNAGTAPTVTIESDGPFLAGESALFTITVTSNNGGGAGRFAAFAASTDGAGRFVAGTEYEVNHTNTNNRARDVERRPFDGGSYSWTVELADLVAGDHTLFVGGNDVDGNDANTNDRGIGATFDFTVEGDAPPDAGAPDAGDPPTGDGGEPPDEDAGAPPPDAGQPPADDAGQPPADGGDDGPGDGGCSAMGVTSTAAPASLALLLALGLPLRRRRRA